MYQFRKIFTNTVTKEHNKFFRLPPFKDTLRCLCTIETPTLERETVIPKGTFGQATCHTHPHLIMKEHLTCGISLAEYKQRRAQFVSNLVKQVENIHNTHVIVIPAARKQYMSDKIPYVFRQNSDFFYLTGCLEPSAILVLTKPGLADHFESVLFVHEKDAHAELWEGPRTGCSAAPELFGVDEARPIENFSTFLEKITNRHTVLWYNHDSPANPEINNEVKGLLRKGNDLNISDPQKTLHLMRVEKSPAEIQLMKETCFIGSQSMNMAMACTKPGISEHLLNAVLEFTTKQGGAEHLAFPPVVAGGVRATHIHYVSNNQLLESNEMLLVDTGSQRCMYNSDISRAWPVSGKFSDHQRILYELVLSVQKRLITILKEQRPTLDRLFDSMCRLLGKELQQEGILPKSIEGSELLGRAYRLCPHHVSHYLGLDVHDSPLVRRNVPICDNMIVTVEPGIYIQPDDTSIPEEFRGIGIRVEDDVLITSGDPVILTESCVKEVDDIEAIVGKHSL